LSICGFAGRLAHVLPFEIRTGTSEILSPIGNKTVANPRKLFLTSGFQETSRIRFCSA
jgi:hypothetical protein